MTNETNDGPFDYLVEKFGAEYTPLERLLVCIMDAQGVDYSTSKKVRIGQALRALADKEIDRINLPDSDIGRGLFKMAELAQADHVSQLKPEHGGPIDGELQDRKALALAEEAAELLGLGESKIEILRKTYNGTYGTDPRSRTVEYRLLHHARFSKFDCDAERVMMNDFMRVAEILKEYGISMNFDDVFWRSVGKDKKSSPKN